MENISIKYLQDYIRAKDYAPDDVNGYFLKLAEEVGELSRAIRKDLRNTNDGVKNTIDEEVYDVIYYAIAIANCYGIDLEKTIPEKEKLSSEKYGNNIKFLK